MTPAGPCDPRSRVLGPVTVLAWTPEVADVYGDLRAQCEAGGVPLAPMDMMIAAHAKALELAALKGGDTAMLITSDRAFWRVPGGLALEDWTQQELS